MKTIDVQIEQETLVSTEQKNMNIPLIISGSLFALILAMSIFLFFGNRSLANNIEKVTAEKATYDTSIAKLKSERIIVAAETMGNAQVEIMKNIRISEAQRYTSELSNIAKKYRVIFTGFSYQGGKISTAAAALTDSVNPTGDAITKVSKLIGDYRDANASIFRLSPVGSVSGQQQQRLFPVEFVVNESITK